MRNSAAVRALLAPTDPARLVGSPQPLVSSDDIIRRADRVDRRRAPRWRMRMPRLAAIASVAVLAAGIAVVYPLAAADEAALAATPPSLSVQYEAGGQPARSHLLAMADALRPGPEPAAGAITYVKTRTWALSTAAADGKAAAALIQFQEELWRAPDGSGLSRSSWLPPQFADENQRRQWERLGGDSPTGTRTVRYKPGERTATPAEPPSADPHRLATQLYAHQPRENGPKSAVRAVADVYRDWVLPFDVRVRVLRFLADQEGLTYRGRATDREGREGVAITADSKGERDLIILDPTTGRLLAHENVLTEKPKGLSIKVPAVFSYLSLLDSRVVERVP